MICKLSKRAELEITELEDTTIAGVKFDGYPRGALRDSAVVSLGDILVAYEEGEMRAPCNNTNSIHLAGTDRRRL